MTFLHHSVHFFSFPCPTGIQQALYELAYHVVKGNLKHDQASNVLNDVIVSMYCGACQTCNTCLASLGEPAGRGCLGKSPKSCFEFKQ